MKRPGTAWILAGLLAVGLAGSFLWAEPGSRPATPSAPQDRPVPQSEEGLRRLEKVAESLRADGREEQAREIEAAMNAMRELRNRNRGGGESFQGRPGEGRPASGEATGERRMLLQDSIRNLLAAVEGVEGSLDRVRAAETRVREQKTVLEMLRKSEASPEKLAAEEEKLRAYKGDLKESRALWADEFRRRAPEGGNRVQALLDRLEQAPQVAEGPAAEWRGRMRERFVGLRDFLADPPDDDEKLVKEVEDRLRGMRELIPKAGERGVALGKDRDERLRKEILFLRERISRLERELDGPDGGEMYQFQDGDGPRLPGRPGMDERPEGDMREQPRIRNEEPRERPLPPLPPPGE